MAYLTRFIKYSCLIILLAFSIASCNSSVKKSDNTNSVNLVELLNQLPAQNKVSGQLVTSEIIRQAPASFEQIIKLLDNENKDLKLQSKYALSLLTDYFAKTPEIQYLQNYQKVIQKAIISDFGISDKIFLIEQLGLCGTDESLDFLGDYLYQDQTRDAALRAMVQINSQETAASLLDHLDTFPVSAQVAAIKTFGELQYQKAAQAILRYADSDQTVFRQVACFSLANLGYPPAESILRNNMESNDPEKKKKAIDNFVLWVTNLDDASVKSHQTKEIINNKQGKYLTHHRLTVLNDCIRNQCSPMYDYLNLLVGEDNQKLSIESLCMTSAIADDEMTNWLIGQLNQSPIRSEIVRALGERGDRKALPALYPGLEDTSYSVQKESVRSIRKLGGYEILFQNLASCANETVCNLLLQELLQVEKEHLTSGLNKIETENLSPKSKQSVIKIIAKRNLYENVSFVRKSLHDDDANVRIAAISAIMSLDDQQSLGTLIDGFFEIKDEKEARNAVKCIVNLLRSSEERNYFLANLEKNKVNISPPYTSHYSAVLKGVGGTYAYHMLQTEIQNFDTENHLNALEALYNWPDEFALDTLVQMAIESNELREKVKAIRASLRILRENEFSAKNKLDYYRQLMPAASRAEEKQMVLSGVMMVQSDEAIDFIIKQLKDADLRQTAIKALLQTPDDEQFDYWAASVSKKLLVMQFPQDSIEKYINEQIDPELNRPPEGFVALFNGQDLYGWKGLVADPVRRKTMSINQIDSLQKIANEDMYSHWFVDNGILRFDGKGANLCTIKEYKNFELLVDWKIEKGGDSGIYLREMPQVQIKDQYLEMGGSGGLYNNKIGENQPLEIADREPGEWNQFRIKMAGNRVTVFLNGRLIVDNVRLENYWEREEEAYESGSIELQAHNSPLYFRNIFIKELPSNEKREGKLFNGRDLTGWEIVNSEKNTWHVNDGILSTDSSGGGWLSTGQQYDDFQLTLEFRVSPGGNSGIFLRAPHQGDPAYTGMEIQILDDYAEKYASLKPWQYTASVYGVKAARPGNSLKAGEWQKMKIVCDGPDISVELNDKNVIDMNIIENMWQSKSHPGLKRRSGFLGLQSHGSKVEFKNIHIKDL